jgi:hypothetical protein
MQAINTSLTDIINKFNSKQLTIEAIFKKNIANSPAIELLTTNPIQYTTLLYKTQQMRDNDWNLLDESVFWLLPFNPNKYPSPM